MERCKSITISQPVKYYSLYQTHRQQNQNAIRLSYSKKTVTGNKRFQSHCCPHPSDNFLFVIWIWSGYGASGPGAGFCHSSRSQPDNLCRMPLHCRVTAATDPVGDPGVAHLQASLRSTAAAVTRSLLAISVALSRNRRHRAGGMLYRCRATAG